MGLLSRIGDALRSLSRVQRELIFLALGLVLGLVAAPAATWLVGTAVLGPYAGGGSLGALLANFFRALGNGAPSFWFVALGPYALILLVRALVAVLWSKPVAPATERAASPPQPRRAPPADRPRRTAPTLAPEAPQRAAPQQRPAPQQRRPAGPTPNVRKTPFIKSID